MIVTAGCNFKLLVQCWVMGAVGVGGEGKGIFGGDDPPTGVDLATMIFNFFVRWHYAMNSVLEEDIRRRRQMWSWSFIRKHRQLMKQYREAYVKKLSNKKVPKDLQKTLDVSIQIEVKKSFFMGFFFFFMQVFCYVMSKIQNKTLVSPFK